MILECAMCGAPLDVSGGIWTKCNYCRHTQRVRAMHPTTQVPAAPWQPPPTWSPPQGSGDLAYRPVSPAFRYSKLLAWVVAVLLVVGAISSRLFMLQTSPRSEAPSFFDSAERVSTQIGRRFGADADVLEVALLGDHAAIKVRRGRRVDWYSLSGDELFLFKEDCEDAEVAGELFFHLSDVDLRIVKQLVVEARSRLDGRDVEVALLSKRHLGSTDTRLFWMLQDKHGNAVKFDIAGHALDAAPVAPSTPERDGPPSSRDGPWSSRDAARDRGVAPPRGMGNVTLTVSKPCKWKVDGKPQGGISPGTPLTISLPVGTHEITCERTPDPSQSEMVEVTEERAAVVTFAL